MKYHYFAFVSWHIVNQVRSAVKSRVQPRGGGASSTWTVRAQVEGGSRRGARGHRMDESVALAGVAEEISIPVGAFSKCCLRVLTCKLQTHSGPLFLGSRPINQLPERKKKPPWPGLILLGQGEPEWKVEGRSAPPILNLLHVLSSLVLFGGSADWSALKPQNKWEESCFTASKCTLVPTDVTF